MMVLYHGSYVAVQTPFVKLGRTKVDFGQGFYLTKLYSQAKSWAKTISERKGRRTIPVISLYLFDYEALLLSPYRVKIFDTYNLEWLDYVINCRKGGNMQSQYDIVEGGVANDRVIDTVEDYENGIITAEQALGQLKYKDINHQICIINQEIIEKYLVFLSSEILDRGED